MAEKSKLTFRFHYPVTSEETQAAVKMLIRFAAECVSNKVADRQLNLGDEGKNIGKTCSA